MTKNKHFMEVQKSIDFIEDNLLSKINVKTVCNATHFSPWEFQRIFRALTGDSIANYIRGRRLSLASNDLKKYKDKRILDIAVKFQFGSQESFTRAFKTKFNITPGQARLHDKVFSALKPKLSVERLEHISNYLNKEPEIKVMGNKQLMGLGIEVLSTLGNDYQNALEIREHWEYFMSRTHEINNIVKDFSYGALISADGFMESEKFTYLASVEVGVGEQINRHSFKYQQIKEETLYAYFKMTGNQKSCQITADYIYGIWLPQSQFVRDEGVDIEVFDHKLYGEERTSFYCLPIKKA